MDHVIYCSISTVVHQCGVSHRVLQGVHLTVEGLDLPPGLVGILLGLPDGVVVLLGRLGEVSELPEGTARPARQHKEPHGPLELSRYRYQYREIPSTQINTPIRYDLISHDSFTTQAEDITNTAVLRCVH